MQRYRDNYGISIRSHFTNYSNKTMVVKYRSGLVCMMPNGAPTLSTEGRVEIEIDYLVPNMMSIDQSALTTPLDKEILRQLNERLYDAEKGYIKGQGVSSQSMKIDIILDGRFATPGINAIESDFLGCDIYVNPTDPTLNSYGPKAAQEKQRVKLNTEKSVPGSLAFEIVFKDTHGLAGNLWTQLLGDSIQIPVTDLGTEPDGVYIYRVGTLTADPKVEFIPLEQILKDPGVVIKHGLYWSKKEAEEGGNCKIIQELQSRVATLQREAAKDTARLKDIIAGLEAKIVTLQNELTELKVNANALKNQQRFVDERNRLVNEQLKSKNSSTSGNDFIKNVISIAGLFFSGYKLFALK